MKQVVLIIHAGLKIATTDLLRTLDNVNNFILTEVEGHGAQAEEDLTLSIRDKVVGYIPQLRVDILVDDDHVDSVLAALHKNENGLNLRPSIFWITTVERQGSL